MMEQEIESLSKDKQELQDKFSEKSRPVYYYIVFAQCYQLLILYLGNLVFDLIQNIILIPGRREN